MGNIHFDEPDDARLPDFDVDDAILGTWIENNRPRSVAARRFLAEMLHLMWRAEMVELEDSVRELREQILRDYALWCAKQAGGVQ